jgi:hypothetical protein
MTPRTYTRAQVLELLGLKYAGFWRLKRAGRLPWVQAIQPAIRGHALYRAEPLDRYLAGDWPDAAKYSSAHRRKGAHASAAPAAV